MLDDAARHLIEQTQGVTLLRHIESTLVAIASFSPAWAEWFTLGVLLVLRALFR